MNNIMNNFLTLKHNKTADIIRQKCHDNDNEDQAISLTDSLYNKTCLVLEMYRENRPEERRYKWWDNYIKNNDRCYFQ